MGTLLIAVSLFTPQATAAALYYTVHSTLAAALLFLVADLVMERRGGAIIAQRPMAQTGLIASLFFVGSIAMAGMPPLSGFLGKLLVMDAAHDHALMNWIWLVILAGSLITIIGLARAGSEIFWKSHDASHIREAEPELPVDDTQAVPEEEVSTTPALPFVACFSLIAGLALLTVFAGPMMDYFEATAAQLFEPSIYIDAVLRRAEQ